MDKTIKKVLPNGLTLILQENHNTPVVSLNLMVKVGSALETDDEAGLSHVIEHMLFKGTKKRGVGVISQEIEALGGYVNAYTWLEETVYYINIASRFAKEGLDILADAAIHSQFDAEELAREKIVVLEELARYEDDPGRYVGEILFGEAFDKHPYRRPVIGYRKVVESFDREKVVNFYKRWYVASNMVLILVGDVDEKTILPLVEDLFAGLPQTEAPISSLTPEPPQKGFRAKVHPMAIEGTYFDFGFHIPGVTHEDVAGLDVLAHILGGGDSSRLEQIIKEKKGLATSIYAAAFTPKDPCLFFVGGHLPEKTVLEACEAIGQEISRMLTEPVSLQELERCKMNLKSAAIYEKETVEGTARKLAFFERHAGDFRYEEKYYVFLEQVTGETLLHLARKYLTIDNLSAAFCIPDRLKDKITKEALEFALRRGLKCLIKKNKGEKLTEERFKNGLRLILRENHGVPVVSIHAIMAGGLRYETKASNGISSLLTSVWTKQTVTRSNLEISEQGEAIAGGFSSFGGRNSLGLRGSFLASRLSEGLQLFSELLLHPIFPEEELVRERERLYEMIKSEEDSLTTLVFKQFFSELYGVHPYGLPSLGTRSSLKKLKSKDLKVYYQKIMNPKNLVIAVSGDFDSAEVKARLFEKLGSLKVPSQALKTPLKPKQIRGLLEKTLRRDKKQAHIAYGFLGSTIRNKDRYQLEVLSSILSGMSGRLFMELRDKQSLAYTVTSQSVEGVDPGYFAVYMGTDPAKLDAALKGIHLELAKVCQELVTEEELLRTQNYLIGNYELDLQKNSTVAALLASDVLFGLGLNEWTDYPKKIRAVTRKQILETARRYITPNHAVLSVIKP